MSVLLKFDHVYAGYGKEEVIKDLSFEVEEGMILGVIGPSGCGKTSMFDVLVGGILPMKGKIYYDGLDITMLAPEKRCQVGISKTYQLSRPFENLTVFENVLVSAVHATGEGAISWARSAYDALELAGLRSKANIKAEELTALGRKRMEIARALSTNPGLLLLDEVAAGLSDTDVHEIMDLVSDLRRERKLTILWTERILEPMSQLTDALMYMTEGRNWMLGAPSFVLNSLDTLSANLTLSAGLEDQTKKRQPKMILSQSV
jgi:branched-chain amino acid transport system ATP-binding protein